MHGSACAKVRAPVRARLELADVVRQHGEAYRRAHVLSSEQQQVLGAIERCRTAELGGHLEECLDCGHEHPCYNSCRDRHCPKCQALAQACWVAGRVQRLLPVGYFHVVFTLPAELRGLARRNRSLVFALLLRCAANSLLDLGRDPKRLGAQLGVTVVLHTWNRELGFHPHVHCIVTGGGLGLDRTRWVHCRPKHLLPVQALSALFRGKLLAALRTAHRQGHLTLGPNHLGSVDPEAFQRLLAGLYRRNWHVYAKRPFGGPEQVLRYLGRYTHRVGLSNDRLVSMTRRGVTFRTKNGQSITLVPQVFLRRFLEHVLPHGFVKIRHYGLMASSNATTKLELARRLLEPQSSERRDSVLFPAPDRTSSIAEAETADPPHNWRALLHKLTGIDIRCCQACGSRNLTRRSLPQAAARAPPTRAA